MGKKKNQTNPGLNVVCWLFQNRCCSLHLALGIAFHPVQDAFLCRITLQPLKKEKDPPAEDDSVQGSHAPALNYPGIVCVSAGTLLRAGDDYPSNGGT